LSRISSTSGHPDVPDIIDWGNLSQWMLSTKARQVVRAVATAGWPERPDGNMLELSSGWRSARKSAAIRQPIRGVF